MNEILSVVLSALIDTSSVMVILFLYRYVFGLGLNLNLKKMGALAGIFVVLDMICHSVLSVYSPTWCVVIYLSVIFVVFGTKRRWLLFLYIVPVFLLYNNITMYMSLFDTTFGMGEFFFYYCDILITLPLLILWAIWVERKQIIVSVNIWEILFIGFYSFMGKFYQDICEIIRLNVLLKKNTPVYQILWFVFVTIINGCIIAMFVYRKKHAYAKQMSHLYQKYFEQEYQAFQEKNERQRELDRLRHDWKNHVNTVQSMWQNGESQKAVEYVASLAEESKQNTNAILSGNEVADAILNLKYEAAKKAGIEFQVKGDLSGLGELESVDICVLFGNALDNALEACGKGGQDSFIKLTTSENQGYLLLTIENTLQEPITLKNHRPVTSKKNPSEHGFGVLGMEHVVHKYQGDLRFEILGDVFKVQVMLPVKK